MKISWTNQKILNFSITRSWPKHPTKISTLQLPNLNQELVCYHENKKSHYNKTTYYLLSLIPDKFVRVQTKTDTVTTYCHITWESPIGSSNRVQIQDSETNMQKHVCFKDLIASHDQLLFSEGVISKTDSHSINTHAHSATPKNMSTNHNPDCNGNQNQPWKTQASKIQTGWCVTLQQLSLI